MSLGITVNIVPSNAEPGFPQTYNAGDPINLSTTYNGAVEFQIEAGTSDVGAVTITANNASGSTSVVIRGNPQGGHCGDVASVTRAGTSTAAVHALILSSGDVGPVSVTSLDHSHGLSSFSTISTVGDIGKLTSASFTGDIISTAGSIQELYNTVGNTGSSGNPIDIRAAVNIGIVGGLSIYANIYGSPGYEDTVTVGRVQSATGPIVGSIRMATFGSVENGTRKICPGTNLDADVTILGTMDFTSSSTTVRPTITVNSSYKLLSGRTIFIGDSLLGQSTEESPIALDFQAGGLQGQVIINGNDDSGVWTAPVEIGTIKLDNARSQPNQAPYYQYKHTGLGGGAIGLVPFNVNDVDCEPEHDSIVCDVGTREWPDESVRETIVIRHYGPVVDARSGDIPVVVESKSLDCPSCSWSEVLNCEVLVGEGQGGREIWVSLELVDDTPVDFTYGLKYQITPRTHGTTKMVRSGGTGLSPEPPVYAYEYSFGILCTQP